MQHAGRAIEEPTHRAQTPARTQRGNGRNASAHMPHASHAAQAHLIHRMHGRARFRIRAHRNDPDYFESLAGRLRRVPGVSNVETNATTGSVLVQHDGSLDDFAAAISDDSPVGKLVEFVLQSPPVSHRLRKEITVLDDTIQRFSGGELDLGTVASFGLLGLAGVQLFLGQQLASAVSLAWYAAELIRRSSSGEPNGTPPD